MLRSLRRLSLIVDDGRGVAVAVEKEARILAAEFVIDLDEKVAELEIEYPRHDQRRRRQRHAGRIVDRRQALQTLAHRLDMSGGMIPGNIGNRAQHRIEHDGARHFGGAERAADRSVIVGEKEIAGVVIAIYGVGSAGGAVKMPQNTILSPSNGSTSRRSSVNSRSTFGLAGEPKKLNTIQPPAAT